MRSNQKMKKKLVSFISVIALLFSLTTTAFATESQVFSVTRASEYLDGYSVGIEARGNGEIAVAMTVDGVGIMEKIGVSEVYIEKKVNGVWKEHETQDAVEHPEFYDYNSRDYIGNAYFYGTPGVRYRVTLTVYARNSKGSDTGYITSYTVVCE